MEDQLKNALREEMRQRLKQRLEEVEAGERTTKVRRIPPRIWGIAAGIALLVTALTVFWQSAQPIPPAELAQELFEPLPNVLAPALRGDAQAQSKLQSALDAYSQGHYAQAIEAFENLPDSLQSGQTAVYLASAFFAEGQNEEVIAMLEPTPREEASQWLLCLAYLAQGQVEKARSLAEQLQANASPYYQERAADLLRQTE